MRIANNNRNLAVDLSEAQVFYCYGKAAGATCGSGWWPDGALNGYKTGVVDAACFPYTAGDQNCNLCSNWKDRLTAICRLDPGQLRHRDEDPDFQQGPDVGMLHRVQ